MRKTKAKESIIGFYGKLPLIRRVFILLGLLAVLGAGFLLLAGIGDFNLFGGNTSLPSLLKEDSSLKPKAHLPSLIRDTNTSFPSLLLEVTPETPGFEGFICKLIYDANMSNFTYGDTSCYRQNGTFDCLCIKPFK